MSATVNEAAPQRGFFGQPKGLSSLFFTEMWERFSYYGMKALLVIYLYKAVSEGGLGIPKETAIAVGSVYAAAVYMGSLPGGWLADRLLGAQKALLYGGILIMFGHISMAIPAGASTTYLGLILIVLGTSLLKPNISSIVGRLYREDDPRRDAGFTIFYMSINIGGGVAPLLCGFLAAQWGYHVGFGVAAIGMFFGLVQYVLTRKNLGEAGLHPTNPLPADQRAKIVGRLVGIVLAVVAAVVAAIMLGVLEVGGVVLLISALSILLPAGYFMFMLRSDKTTPVERDRVKAYIPLFIGATLFWMIFEQAGTVLNIYAEERVDRDIFGWEFPAPWFQSVNPAFIVLLAPLVAALWLRLGTRQPSTPRKFAVALVLIGLSFGILAVAGLSGEKVAALWLLLVFAVQTVGELCLSPVGLSATTKLAPAAFSSQMMGLWFLATAAGNGIAGQIAPLSTTMSELAYFGLLGGAAILLAVFLWIGANRVKRLMHGVN
ncbi:peptide MFS transporter [Crossiella cryophila]|uniref:POT family proton-dependent oligopeptide transporter n=1 Tax=Crossiella cryophila TaxID=43355 RepID=A0A7W7FSZ9_9PSEU|nr:peptide MFS transporter [Crossiella cryophila]MBB4677601.1 POT family proton-dependent oligopeptide transporter [Crossiella cryophila]